MNYLFIHQNFPGQFVHVAKILADAPQHRVVGIGEAHNLKGKPPIHPRIVTLAYEPHGAGRTETHHYVRDFESHIRRGQSLARVLLKLRQQGFLPEVIVVHPGWGEALFVKDVFPEARLIAYCEYYYQGAGGDVGFDPEFPAELDDRLRVRVKNSTQLLSLVAADQGISPTHWQRSRYPGEFQGKIEVIHDGIDTEKVAPDSRAWVEVDGRRFRAGDEVVTYVARNLEPYRGFHVFMRALPGVLDRRPDAHVLIVGGDDISYGKRLSEGETYRARYLAELGDRVDWSRVHFLGRLPYNDYLKVLQVSAAHVYLTYPFVLSWSMLEAMAAGCFLVASDTQPVREVIRDRENGRLVGFFDYDGLADIISAALASPVNQLPLRESARRTILARYDLKTQCLPRLQQFINGQGQQPQKP